jgi:hypothetical protein
MNHVLHVAAIVQLRNDTEGRAYYRRKHAAGKTPLEALRSLKRRLSDVVHRQLMADADTAEQTGPGGHRGATQESSAVDLPPHIDTSDQPLPGPAQPTLPPAPPGQNPDTASTAPPSAPTRRSRQVGAPHRTNDLDGDKRRCTLKGDETAAIDIEGSHVRTLVRPDR